jgi:hypothetical protein
MTTKTDFLVEFRTITQYGERILSNSEVEAVMGRAKKHIRSRKDLPDDFDFLSDSQGEEALFWYTCLFAKVATGELDSQEFSAGALDAETLLAKADDDVTEWYRKAVKALRNLRAENMFRTTSPARTDREYAVGSFGEQSGGSSTEVENTDI